jgi:glycosyltransferase involved in cell wall biosynthesis
MRVLFYTNVFPNPVSPTKGTFNRQLARALAQSHDVRAIVPVSWVDELRARHVKRRDTIDGIDVHYPRFIYPPKVAREYFDWWMHVSTRGTAEAMFRDWRPEAIVAYWAHPDGAVATRLARKLGVPVVIMVGGTDVNLLMNAGRRREKIVKTLAEADAVVTVSRDLLSTLLNAGLKRESLHVIDRGVDASKFSPSNRADARRRLGLPVDGQLLVWVGRMVEVKRLDILLEAAALLRDRGVPPFRIQLVGDGGLRKALEAQAQSLGLGEIVGFAGSQPHDALPDYYRAADLTVLPSRTEGIPNVLRESLASGTPFVASRVGGIPELAAGLEDCCRLVPPCDPTALADALADALTTYDPHPVAPLGSSQSWGESAAALMTLVASLTNARQAQPSIVAHS